MGPLHALIQETMDYPTLFEIDPAKLKEDCSIEDNMTRFIDAVTRFLDFFIISIDFAPKYDCYGILRMA